jgi:hypothetical protein
MPAKKKSAKKMRDLKPSKDAKGGSAIKGTVPIRRVGQKQQY